MVRCAKTVIHVHFLVWVNVKGVEKRVNVKTITNQAVNRIGTPNTVSQNQEEETELTIKDALANEKEISVRAVQLPIINRQLLDHDFDTKLSLRDLFESTRIGLIERLEKILY